MLNLLARPRTRMQRATRMVRKAGGTLDVNRLLLGAYFYAYGEPWDRQPWHHQGANLADMFGGRCLKRIPRELRRIYAPYP
jgi:hypothetical protein